MMWETLILLGLPMILAVTVITCRALALAEKLAAPDVSDDLDALKVRSYKLEAEQDRNRQSTLDRSAAGKKVGSVAAAYLRADLFERNAHKLEKEADDDEAEGHFESARMDREKAVELRRRAAKLRVS